jgi:hypothetical protein
MHLFGNQPIDEYLLVQAAMVVEWVLESLFMELNLHGPAVRATDTTPVMLAWLRIHDLGPGRGQGNTGASARHFTG